METPLYDDLKWISVKDRLPQSSEEIVLVIRNNIIYMGSFHANESYTIDTNGIITNYQKHILFRPTVWLDKNYCDNCEKSGEHGNCGTEEKKQCNDCCEKDYEMALMVLEFDVEEITHWMSLPNKPQD